MRKLRLADCNPRWGTFYGEAIKSYITFDCPEGHENCHHTIPFKPDLDGNPVESKYARWDRTGSDFETLTLHPSIKRTPTANDPCHMHVVLTNGMFAFGGDSG